jgi:hypothetical protein
VRVRRLFMRQRKPGGAAHPWLHQGRSVVIRNDEV